MLFGGPKLNTVFASRWKAAMWAAGVLMTAYCSIPGPDEDQTSTEKLIAAHIAKPAPAHPKSPWAKDAN